MLISRVATFSNPQIPKSPKFQKFSITVSAIMATVIAVMQNPFVYGEVVPASAFVNRVSELDRLVSDLAAGQKIFLISPRRYGKSSLIRQALSAMARRGAVSTEVTVSSVSSYVSFLEGYARAIA